MFIYTDGDHQKVTIKKNSKLKVILHARERMREHPIGIKNRRSLPRHKNRFAGSVRQAGR